jgi:phosphoribosylanthranilate isomerase
MDRDFRTRLKICGVTNKEDAIIISALGADAIGFVLAESKRKITPDKAREIIKILPPFMTTVGIFMNTALSEVNEITEYAFIDVVQLHGNETTRYLHSFWTLEEEAEKHSTGIQRAESINLS